MRAAKTTYSTASHYVASWAPTLASNGALAAPDQFDHRQADPQRTLPSAGQAAAADQPLKLAVLLGAERSATALEPAAAVHMHRLRAARHIAGHNRDGGRARLLAQRGCAL
jgi:hypothetical protein